MQTLLYFVAVAFALYAMYAALSYLASSAKRSSRYFCSRSHNDFLRTVNTSFDEDCRLFHPVVGVLPEYRREELEQSITMFGPCQIELQMYCSEPENLAWYQAIGDFSDASRAVEFLSGVLGRFYSRPSSEELLWNFDPWVDLGLHPDRPYAHLLLRGPGTIRRGLHLEMHLFIRSRIFA